MADLALPVGALVLYRSRPARIAQSGDKLELELAGGETARVRVKDVELLHPGPMHSLNELRPLPGEMRTAWELLAGTETSLPELASLAFGNFSPASAWAAWQFVADGLYFSGSAQKIQAATIEEVDERKQAREARAAEEWAWAEFLERARRGSVLPADDRYLKEVELLAMGAASRSRALRELGRSETPENAHALLLETGFWTSLVNPYPRRMGMPLSAPDLPVQEVPDEPRLDLSGLAAFAIDDEGTDNPDDAISLEGDTWWIHIADPAAVVKPESELDLEARGRGTTLHLPEGAIHLLPDEMTRQFGLGLQEESPALSFGFRLGSAGEILDLRIAPSRVRVQRLTYEQANQRMEEPPFQQLEALAQRRRARRNANGAIDINLPEARLSVDNGRVEIHPVLNLRSRVMVEESMILVGEGVAAYAGERKIPLPFSQQEKAETILAAETRTETQNSLSAGFALRRILRRGQYRTTPGAHSGLGLAWYAQSTSPLRRYLDLVVHQQLRAHLRNEPLLSESDLLERIGAVEAVGPALRQAEVLSERHWTLVYLMQHAPWRGEGILVEKRGATGTLILPDLAFEAHVHLNGDPALDSCFQVEVGGISLPTLEISLNILKSL